MQDEKSHIIEPIKTEDLENPSKINPLQNKGFSRNFLKSGGSLLAIGAIGIIGVWLMRENVAQSSIEAYLKSKGVDAAIEFDDLQLDGAKFKKLTLSKSGKETLSIINGNLKWHFARNQQLVIDEIIAKQAIFNFGINKNGLDLGAIAPLMSKGGGKSKLLIGDINIDELKISIDSFDNKFILNGKINGSGEKGISAGFLVKTPNDIATKPIALGIKTNAISKKPIQIGFNLIAQNNSITPIKNAKINNLNVQIGGDIEIGKNEKQIINIYNSQIAFDNFTIAKTKVDNGKITMERGFFDIAKDINKDLIFTYDGKAQFSKLSLANGIINEGNFDIASARAKSGRLRIAAKGNLGNSNFGQGFSSANLETIFDFDAKDLSKITDANFTSSIIGKINNINSLELKNISKNLIPNSLGNLVKSPNLSFNAKASGNFNNIYIKPNGPIILSSNNGEKISFIDENATSIFNIITNANTSDFSLIAKGKINGANNEGFLLNSNLNGLSFNSQGFGAQFSATKIKEANIDGQVFDLDLTKAHILQNKNSGLSGNFKGQINGRNPKTNGFANFDINIAKNEAKIKSDGFFKSLENKDLRLQNLKFALNGNGNIKQKINLFGAGFFGDLSIGQNQFSNGNTKFEIAYFPNEQQANTKILTDIGSFKASDFSGNNLKTNIIGQIKLGEKIQYNGNLIANTGKFAAKENVFENTNIAGPLNISFSKDEFRLSSSAINANIGRFYNNEINLKNFSANGPISMVSSAGNFALSASNCMKLLFDSLQTSGNFMGRTDGFLCPDNKGRLLAINNGKTNIYAATNIGETSFILGKGENAPSININKLKGGFAPNAKGVNEFKGFADGLNFKFSTAPNEWAQISAKNTNLSIFNDANGTKILAQIRNFTANGLPIELNGEMKGQFNVINGQAPSADFDLTNIIVKDKGDNPRFATFELSGRGELENQKLTMFGEGNLNKTQKNIAQIYLDHNLNNGKGSVIIDASKLEFSPKRPINLDMDDIIPPLQGIFVNTTGPLEATAKIEWEPDKKIKSGAIIKTDNLSFDGTLLSMSGISGKIEISDLFKLKTSEQQNIKIKEMNPGLPIIDGKLGFEFNGDNSINFNEISWTLADGTLSLKPINIPFATGPQNLEINAQNIDIEKLLRLAKIPNLEVEGKMSGKLPVIIKDNSFEIIGGLLLADGAGVLKYTGPSFGTDKPKPKGFEKLKSKFTGGPAKGGAELAISALRNLRYKILEIRVDGKITGIMQFKILLEGSNPEILNGQLFRFNIKLDIPLGELHAYYQNIFNPKIDFEKAQ